MNPQNNSTAAVLPAERQCWSFPEPAIAPVCPTIRIVLGKVKAIKLGIYDVDGQKVHTTVITLPTEIVDDQYYYDYQWRDLKSAGPYWVIAEAEFDSGLPVRVKTKLTVVR